MILAKIAAVFHHFNQRFELLLTDPTLEVFSLTFLMLASF
jgi:hypothetical protein